MYARIDAAHNRRMLNKIDGAQDEQTRLIQDIQAQLVAMAVAPASRVLGLLACPTPSEYFEGRHTMLLRLSAIFSSRVVALIEKKSSSPRMESILNKFVSKSGMWYVVFLCQCTHSHSLLLASRAYTMLMHVPKSAFCWISCHSIEQLNSNLPSLQCV